MNRSSWRNLAITVVLAFAAAYIGARLGSSQTPPQSPPMLRETIYQMVHHDLKLTPAQTSAIAQIDQRYEHRRNGARADISAADAELAQALANEMALGTAAERALVHIQGSLGQMQRDAVLYVLDVRAVLTPDQQEQFDKKIFETLALSPM